jgi:hypothetical protein
VLRSLPTTGVVRGGVRNEAEKKSGDEMKAASAQ